MIEQYQSGFYYQYKSNGYPTPAGFNITMQATVISSGADELADHPGTLADYVPTDTFVALPSGELSQGLKSYSLSAADGGPFDPPDNGNATAAIIGSHTTQLPDGA
ncbi:MAG: hypothetical protein AAFW82_10555 [Pseudomonadota bacterium]